MEWTKIFTVCGYISVVGAAIAVIAKWIKPAINYSRRLEEVERHDKKDIERFDEIEKRLKVYDSASQAQFKAIVALMDHGISGNSIDKLKDARDELTKYIIEK